MSLRAGIVVTGTEVLSGRVSDRNGPWLADRLRELGVDHAYTTIVGDRPEDMRAALDFMDQQGMDVVLTSGGLGPTADDMTAAVVAEFQDRALELDGALEQRIAAIIEPLMKRWPDLDRQAIAASTRKQALVPAGAGVLEPIGTAPGFIVAPRDRGRGPTIIVLPGPPRELRPMWDHAQTRKEFKAAMRGATAYRQRMLRLFGIPESEIAETLRVAERESIELERLEITTCLKRGEIEVVTRYEPGGEQAYDALASLIERRHADTLFSRDGSSIDEQVAALLRPLSIATAESCTGGQLAARLTEPAGASQYVLGGIVAYSNEAKTALAGVPASLIAAHGAVSAEIAQALAEGARAALGASVGVGVTGIAGPDGGTDEKPVGLVWLSVAAPQERSMTRSVHLPGAREDVRDRATTVALHMLRRTLT